MNLLAGVNSLLSYVQCQEAPPQILDIFLKSCDRTIDCLPSLCCQEGDRKVCRPPKKSVIGFISQATQVGYSILY